MRALVRSTAAVLLAAAGGVPAQESRSLSTTAPPRESLASLAERLGRSLRAPDAPAAVTAFRAFLTVTPKAPTGTVPAQDGVQQNHQVRTAVLYSDPDWIRYEIRGQKVTPLRMHDGESFWQIDSGGKKTKLGAKETKSTTDRMKQEISLAQQLTRLVYLDSLLLKLEGPQIEEEEHRPPGASNQPSVPVYVIRGVVERFPMYAVPDWGQDARVRLEVRLRRDTLEPVAVRARPVDPRLQVVEEVRVEGTQLVQGIRLPRELRLYEVDPKGNRVYKQQVELTNVEVNPPVDRSRDFGFPKEAVRTTPETKRGR